MDQAVKGSVFHVEAFVMIGDAANKRKQKDINVTKQLIFPCHIAN